MKRIIVITIFLICNNLFGQINESLCDLGENNRSWKSKFTNAGETEKINLIKEKIKFDSNYVDLKPTIITSHKIIDNGIVDKNGNKCERKILFIIIYAKNQGKIIDVRKNSDWFSILEKLDERNVEKIEYMFDDNAEKIYGSLAKVGAIVISIKDKNLKKQIKRIAT